MPETNIRYRGSGNTSSAGKANNRERHITHTSLARKRLRAHVDVLLGDTEAGNKFLRKKKGVGFNQGGVVVVASSRQTVREVLRIGKHPMVK